MKPYSQQYAIPQAEDSDETRRSKRQMTCPHETLNLFRKGDRWSKTCSSCRLVISSDAMDEPSVRSDEIFL